MFTRARFNATKFNITSTVNEILLQAVFSDFLQANMGITVEYRVDSITFSAMLEQYSLGTSGIPTGNSLSEGMLVETSPFLAAPVEAVFSEVLNASKIHASTNCYLDAALSETVRAQTTVGANVWFALPLEGRLTVDAAAGANVAADGVFTELLTLRSEASVQEEQVLLVRVTIPVGGELRIDSENYTVTLNGENVLHLQEGDWLALDRGLVSVMVDSGTKGRLEGQMVVTERYL